MVFGKHINRYYLRYAPVLLLGLFALILVDYFQLEIPEYYQMVVNGMNDGAVTVEGELLPFDMDFLLDRVCLPMIFVVLAMVTGRFLWRICFFGSAIRVETDLRNRMFDHCKGLSRQYYQVNKVGGLMSLFTNDLETVQDCFGSGIMMMLDAAFLGALAVLKMWRMNPMLTLLSMIPMAFLMASGIVVGKYMMKKWDVRQEAFSRLSDFSQESFSGIAVIKAFVKEGKELLAFRQLNRENEDANVDYTRLSVLLRIIVTLFVESVVCVILGYGGYLVYRDVFNAGQLVEFIGYFTAVVWPVMAVSELIEMSSRGRASLKRISELLDAPVDVFDRPGVREIPEAIQGKIEFRHLTFRYPDGEFDALSDVSFVIEPGENVGLVGKTGAGKAELEGWERSDLLGLLLDTRSIVGSLEAICPPLGREDARLAVQIGACNLYHACSHNYLHTRSPEILRGLYKSARFVVRMRHYAGSGAYIASMRELEQAAPEPDRQLLQLCRAFPLTEEPEFDRLSRVLLEWSSAQLRVVSIDKGGSRVYFPSGEIFLKKIF